MDGISTSRIYTNFLFSSLTILAWPQPKDHLGYDPACWRQISSSALHPTVNLLTLVLSCPSFLLFVTSEGPFYRRDLSIHEQDPSFPRALQAPTRELPAHASETDPINVHE